MKTAVFVYESSQVPYVSEVQKRFGECEIIAVGADIEFLLEERGIPFCSARGMRATSTPERFARAKELGQNMLNTPSVGFFSYRGIHIRNLFTHALQDYL